jgi:hypothetical protein
MALGTKIESPGVKYGAAEALLFGCPESDDFDIVESSSQTQSFGTDMQVKNEVGNTIGSVLADPKIELTLSGMSKQPPTGLGAITEFKTFFTKDSVGSDATGQGESDNKDFIVKSVKQDNSNEDFVKYEVSAECYYNVDYDKKEDLESGKGEHDSN